MAHTEGLRESINHARYTVGKVLWDAWMTNTSEAICKQPTALVEGEGRWGLGRLKGSRNT